MAPKKRNAPSIVTPPVVIDLVDSDDDDDKEDIHRLNDLNNVRKRLKTTPSPRAHAAAASTQIDYDSDDGGGKLGPCCPIMQQRSVKKEGAVTISLLDDDSEHPSATSDEVEVLTNVQEPMMEAVSTTASTHAGATKDQSGSDVQVIGCRNQTKLPHMRQHCTEYEFVQDVISCQTGYRKHMLNNQNKVKMGLETNPKYCEMCYCYVCDLPAKECKQWKSDIDSASASENHCLASDVGADSSIYKSLRSRTKRGISTPPPPAAAATAASVQPSPAAFQAHHLLHRMILAAGSTSLGPGPFSPESATEKQKRHSIKCRRCGWYSRLRTDSTVPGCADWCHKCGRICSDRAFHKQKTAGRAYQPEPTDIFLGTRKISFTIHSHDPRQLDQFKQSWVENNGKPGWEYSAADMDDDMFHHRFSDYSRIDAILASMPVVSPDKIPQQGQLQRSEGNSVSANETEYIVLAKRSDRVLLEELAQLNMFSRRLKLKKNETDPRFFNGDIRATWNKARRTGSFSIRVFIKQRALSSKLDGRDVARLLGAWFDLFPYPLAVLTQGAEAKKREYKPSRMCYHTYRAPPFRMSIDQISDIIKDQDMVFDAEVSAFNTQVNTNRSGLSFSSSTGRVGYGGECNNSSDFPSVLKAFFKETFIDELSKQSDDSSMSFVGKMLGIVAHHREMRRGSEVCNVGSYGRGTGVRSLVRDEDHALCYDMIPVAQSTYRDMKSLDCLLHLLENLGHVPIPHVDGLTVELLEFQKQTVQWALERETTPGGIQTFFWTKLPVVEGCKKGLYYNPILGRLTTKKPEVVRGGIIAEQMGLGKTVISLALILQNPAPAMPLSGSGAGSIAKVDDWNGTGWNPHTRNASDPSDRGSIVSRGTLVICHVSLVGQWIEESKSKLDDPGLVYPYHGSARRRNAEILAQNAIVVTTYATLSSDKFYHAKKGGTSYCAPCEQVRWWRIICDESHALKDGATKQSKAVLDLVADNKWCVSGTPINTSIMDLKTQLKFVGIENVDKLFQHFHEKMLSNKSWRRRGNNGTPFNYNSEFGDFLFFMRTVMMRHSMKQKHIGTATELMSLPPKGERTMTVTFSTAEETEYQRLEKDAKNFYEEFKLHHGKELSKHYLTLFQKLTPLRIACCGGGIPEQNEDASAEDEGSDGEDPNEDSSYKKEEKKKISVSNMVFKSKVNVLVKELERIRDEEPNAKSLVFSQYTSTLKFLQLELPKHGFDYRTLSGDMSMKNRAKALHDFQNDPPTTVFLLSMRAGNVGINLTQANRVFILEPAFNPALEAQAIGRVWRMGQKNKVEIIRLITKNSIEERLRKMLDQKYGATTEVATSAESDDAEATTEEESEDAVPEAATRAMVPDAAIVGNIHSDRTQVLTEEFDLLFGTSSSTVCPDVVKSRE